MKKIVAFILSFLIVFLGCYPVYAAELPKQEVQNYKVAFYASPNYHIQDEDGNYSGYGYDMMEEIEKYLPYTFSYVGYDKTPKECEQMLLNGEIDIFTAAKKTEERQKYFAFSKYPAITATTCMNVKRGSTRVVRGDYSTYDGLVIGLLERHTYNDKFIAFTKEKGFNCEIKYYTTPEELRNALIKEEIDASVDSYIRSPEDEVTIEYFGDTPYYFMVRQEDKHIVDEIDKAIDAINLRIPTWRSTLYNKYYGAQEQDTVLTEEEQAYLEQLINDDVVIRGVIEQDKKPFSWYEDETAKGIITDLFKMTAERLGLKYEIVSVSSEDEYDKEIASGAIDICADVISNFQEGDYGYKLTQPYLNTPLSILHLNSFTGKIGRIGIECSNNDLEKIIHTNWPEADIVILSNEQDYKSALLNGDVDVVLTCSYCAEQIENSDLKNRFRSEVVPGTSLQLKMKINSKCNPLFFTIWEKTLLEVSDMESNSITQTYREQSENSSFVHFLCRHPFYFLTSAFVFIMLCIIIIFWIIYTKRRKVQQKKLEEAKDLAEAANKAKSTFLFNMSHDIRTPMNAIVGYTDLILRHPKDYEKCLDYTKKIRASGGFLLSLINNVLEMARIESNKIALDESPESVEQITGEIFAVYSELMKQKNIQFTMDNDVKNDFLYVDKVCIKEIFLNLVSNAYKYTQEGGKVKLSFKELPCEKDGYVLMEAIISDTGIGMSEDYLPHLFEEFTRERNLDDDKQIQGTGLGMPIVKKLIDVMGGTIDVESKLGEGSTFIVRIPHRIANVSSSNNDKETAIDETMFKGKRILLAEDNDLNAEIATEVLSEMGFEVNRAEDGIKCVNMLCKEEPNYYDVILMDIQMPHLDGYGAAKRIRALPNAVKASIPIIAMTANAFDEDKKNAFEAGMDAHLAKPIDVRKLEKELQDVLNNKNSKN